METPLRAMEIGTSVLGRTDLRPGRSKASRIRDTKAAQSARTPKPRGLREAASCRAQVFWSACALRRFPIRSRCAPSALDHVDLDGLDFDALLFEPGDGFFDLDAFAVEFEADQADFIGD